MRLKATLSATVFFAALLIANAAEASPGYVSRSVNLRAGPDVSYPVVNRVRAGTRVEIFGCMEGWNWCEIGFYRDRGWVSGQYLQAFENRRRVYVEQAGPVIQLPIISFEISNYWDAHYRNKPFYRDRGRWEHVDNRRNDHDHDHDNRNFNNHDRNDHDNDHHDNFPGHGGRDDDRRWQGNGH